MESFVGFGTVIFMGLDSDRFCPKDCNYNFATPTFVSTSRFYGKMSASFLASLLSCVILSLLSSLLPSFIPCVLACLFDIRQWATWDTGVARNAKPQIVAIQLVNNRIQITVVPQTHGSRLINICF